MESLGKLELYIPDGHPLQVVNTESSNFQNSYARHWDRAYRLYEADDVYCMKHDDPQKAPMLQPRFYASKGLIAVHVPFYFEISVPWHILSKMPSTEFYQAHE